MVRYPGNLLVNQYLDNSTKNLIHGLLQFVGGALGIGGTLQKYWGKETHFKSVHAKLGKFFSKEFLIAIKNLIQNFIFFYTGLIACILCAFNFVFGLASLFFTNSLGSMRLFHGILGLATFIIGMLAQYYGYETGFFNRNFTYKNSYRFFTLVILALTTIGPLKLVLFRLSKLMYD